MSRPRVLGFGSIATEPSTGTNIMPAEAPPSASIRGAVEKNFQVLREVVVPDDRVRIND